jgi:hypothetical protein
MSNHEAFDDGSATEVMLATRFRATVGQKCFTACPKDLHGPLPARPPAVLWSRLAAEADERWSFVQKKANKQGMWMAMDATTRQSIALHVGDRSDKSGQAPGPISPWCTGNRRCFIPTNMPSSKA